jgi:hypothetical protein
MELEINVIDAFNESLIRLRPQVAGVCSIALCPVIEF